MSVETQSTAVREVPAWNSPAPLVDAARGEVVLVRGALQGIGLMDKFVELTLAGISEVVSPEAAARVAEVGFDRLHEVLPVDSLAPLMNTLTGWFSPLSRQLMKSMLASATAPVALHAPDRAWPRMMVPYDLTAPQRTSFAHYLGHLASHNPHRDSWVSQPLNGVNAWIALGRVRAGNGILLYPDVLRQPIAHDKESVLRGASVGRPITQPMEPGDMLLFQGDHLHSSELNITQFTRYVVSFRYSIGEPVYEDGQRQTKYRHIQ